MERGSFLTHGMSSSTVVSSGGLLVATSPMYSNRKPKSFCDQNKRRLEDSEVTKPEATMICFTLYLQFELIAHRQTGMVALLSPGHNEALVVRGVTMK